MSNGDPHSPPTTAKVFISYRRDDAAGHAGRLYDQINNYFGDRVKVFMDVDSIGPGEDFINVIESAVGKCEILIAVIGKDWLTITDQTGKRRLDNPDDFNRVEIAAALNRNVRVIPVLVQDAEMPRRDQLPEALAGLSRRNAIELSDARWKYDVDRLIKVIEELVGGQAGCQPAKDDREQKRPAWLQPWQIALLAAGLVVAAGLGIWLLVPLITNRTSNVNSAVVEPSPVRTGDTVANVQPKVSPTPTAPSSPTPPQTPAGIQVVRVDLSGGYARGFFTSRGYIVAMVGQMLKANDTTTVSWSEAGQEYKETAEVVRFNDWIALLKLERGLLVRNVRIRNANSLNVGEEVERFIDGNNRTAGRVVQVNATGMKPRVLLTTKISARGEAGSPVIDSQGRIVAMVLGGKEDQTESLPIETIRTFFPEAFSIRIPLPRRAVE